MSDPYASVAENYDIMVDWQARLARERPFFAAIFREYGVKSVLDVGCATGHHSRLFAELSASVLGLDPSAPMIERARSLTPGDNPRFMLGGFEDIPSLIERFDLITVLGNTLAHVETAAGLARVLADMRGAINTDGRLCIQLINYDSLMVAGSRWLPLAHRQVGDREYLFLREHRYLGGKAEFTIITLIKDGTWSRQVERYGHLPLPAAVLQAALHEAGFGHIALYGSYNRESFALDDSPSLIIVAGG